MINTQDYVIHLPRLLELREEEVKRLELRAGILCPACFDFYKTIKEKVGGLKQCHLQDISKKEQ